MSTGRRTVGPVDAVVTAVRAAGAHDVVSLRVPDPDPWLRCRPGQLVVVPTDPRRGAVLPEVHWLAGVSTDPLHGTTVELVLPAERGTEPGQRWRLLGPLGRGFAPPAQPVPALLVAHEDGAVPLRWLLHVLRRRGCPVHVLLSATDPDRHVDLASVRRHAGSVVLCEPGALAAAVLRALEDPGTDPSVVYGAAPLPLLRAVAQVALAGGRAVRVAALDPAAPVVCGTGLCGACDLEVHRGSAGEVLRPCLDGPVLPGEWLVPGAVG